MEIVKYLIPKFGDRKFDLNNYGNTCLHYAAQEGHLAVVKYLVEECGFNPNLGNKVSCCVYVLGESIMSPYTSLVDLMVDNSHNIYNDFQVICIPYVCVCVCVM